MILRMGDCISPAEGFIFGTRPSASPPELFPGLIVHGEIEIWQDHRPRGQLADGTQHIDQRRGCAGDTCGNNRITGRIGPPMS